MKDISLVIIQVLFYQLEMNEYLYMKKKKENTAKTSLKHCKNFPPSIKIRLR